jgi:uracil-DNA glycosylase
VTSPARFRVFIDYSPKTCYNIKKTIAKSKGVYEMAYLFPFGQELHPLIQEDQSPKKVFVLGVYASAVHARWKFENQIICQALAVASEPRIFWDGNPQEAKEIISKIQIPKELGYLEPAGKQLNGPSAKVLDNDILAPLGYTREDAWLCDCLPETRINSSQAKVIKERYNPLIEKCGLNPVTIPNRPTAFCDERRAEEITDELMRSEANLLVLLGDIPIAQYLKKVADVPFSSLSEYVGKYGYGNRTKVTIAGKEIEILPLAHPRQIGALGTHSEKWFLAHQKWENSINKA